MKTGLLEHSGQRKRGNEFQHALAEAGVFVASRYPFHYLEARCMAEVVHVILL